MAASINKVVLEQADVFVHTMLQSTSFYDNIIRGKVVIEEKDGEAQLTWMPIDEYPLCCSVEDEPYMSGEHEWRLLSKRSKDGESSVSYSKAKSTELEEPKSNKLYLAFSMKDLRSLNRSDPKLAWSYIVFVLKDGSTLPALHFHSGGIENLIKTMSRYVWLTRSPISQKRYIVQENSSALKSPFHQLQLDSDKPNDMMTKLMNNTYYGALSNLTKVTRFVLGSGSHHGLQETRPTSLQGGSSGGDHDFEMITDETPYPMDSIIPVARAEPLQPEEWCACFDIDGRIVDHVALKERIFRGGVHQDVRCEAWKFLLGYYDFNSTYREREKLRETKGKEYHVMKQQWMTISPSQTKRFTEFSNRKHLVDKDALRTDRTNPFYAGDDNPNVTTLFNILMTYCMYNFDLGYVQGMSDILSPILMIMENEEDAFWCFTGLMDMEERNFEFVQQFMQEQLLTLGRVIRFMFPKFHQYLETHESANLFFCFRWLLINFKREFFVQDTMTLWEALWTQTLTPHFRLFVALTILEGEKDTIMKNEYGFNEIIKHINDLSGHISLSFVLSRAESICLSLKQTEDIPQDIKDLFEFPHSATNIDIKGSGDGGENDQDRTESANATEQNTVDQSELNTETTDQSELHTETTDQSGLSVEATDQAEVSIEATS